MLTQATNEIVNIIEDKNLPIGDTFYISDNAKEYFKDHKCNNNDKSNDSYFGYHNYPDLVYYSLEHENGLEEQDNQQYFGIELEVKYSDYVSSDTDCPDCDYYDEDYEECTRDGCVDNDDNDVPERLEAERINSANLEGYAWFSDDGSIDYGYEFITHPCTYDFHLNTSHMSYLLRELSEDFPEEYQDDYCGIHIHCSINNLTRRQLTFIHLFILTQQSVHVKFARRLNNSYAKFDRVESLRRCLNNYDIYSDSFMTIFHQRYYAVHLSDKNTIEFRFFKSTLEEELIKAYILFCRELCEFSKVVTIDDNNFNSIITACHEGNYNKEFIKFVEEQSTKNTHVNYSRLLEELNNAYC